MLGSLDRADSPLETTMSVLNDTLAQVKSSIIDQTSAEQQAALEKKMN